MRLDEAREIARDVLQGKTRSHVGAASLLAAFVLSLPTSDDFFDIRLKGWNCRDCGVFNGEEKERQPTCRSCDAPRPKE